MNNPVVSIITITYNSEKTLEDTLKSVINQDYPNLEYILIDGGSSDNTISIIDKYKNKIDSIISEPDKGISDAFNKGITISTGEIIGIINSDDLLLPGALKTVAGIYSENIDVYRGNTIIWNDKTNRRIRAIPSMKFPLYALSYNICHPSTFITKNAYKKWGDYSLNYKYMMDADLLIRFYQNGANMQYLNSDLAVSRLGGITNSPILLKLKEVDSLVSNNNGNRILAKIRVLYFVIYQYSKKILFALFSEHFIRKLGHLLKTVQKSEN